MPARCFIGIALPEALLDSLADARAAFLEADPRWAGEKWVGRELQHVTLAFLGPVPDEAVPGSLDALAEQTRLLGRPSFTLDIVCAMPSPRRASMLWARPKACVPDLGSLARVVLAAFSDIAAKTGSDRPFSPHVTLVRARVARAAPPLALAAASAALTARKDPVGTVSVRSVTLYSSTLGPDGPRYGVLGSVPLGP